MFRLVFMFVILLTACDKKENRNCDSFQKVPVIETESAYSGIVNSVVPVKVTFIVFNGCGQFGRFEQTIHQNLIRIRVIAHYSGCICTADIPRRTATYSFIASKPGTYVVQFEPVSDAAIIQDTITIR
jgi:hypothetical protein